jgi:hypothetical protein
MEEKQERPEESSRRVAAGTPAIHHCLIETHTAG